MTDYSDEAEFAPVNYDAQQQIQARGAEVGRAIMVAVEAYDAHRPRSIQSAARQLGMSEVGGCREYIRATVTGQKKGPTGLKWAAFVGTAVGDYVEKAVKAEILGSYTQETVVVKLNIDVDGVEQQIQVEGHTDIVMGDVVDLKTKDGLEEVKRQGPKLKELIQISGYLLAKYEEGVVGDEALGVLVYMDRAGGPGDVWTFAVDLRMARNYMKLAEQRLGEVGKAIATGVERSYLRDEPESWCFYVKCPFFDACWEGYQPEDEIKHPDLVEAIIQYDEGRALKKKAEELMNSAKQTLNPDPDHKVSGVTTDFTLKWTSKANQSGTITDSIDLRRRPRPVEQPALEQ